MYRDERSLHREPTMLNAQVYDIAISCGPTPLVYVKASGLADNVRHSIVI